MGSSLFKSPVIARSPAVWRPRNDGGRVRVLMLLLRLAFREIRNNKSFSFFFIFNMALGLVGFLALDAFKLSIDASLAERSRLILAADVAVSARRALSPEE